MGRIASLGTGQLHEENVLPLDGRLVCHVSVDAQHHFQPSEGTGACAPTPYTMPAEWLAAVSTFSFFKKTIKIPMNNPGTHFTFILRI